MSGLHRFGVDVNPFGSKYQDRFGGFAAGNGQRTYTKPSYTLYVTGIPDAESSDAVQSVLVRRGLSAVPPGGTQVQTDGLRGLRQHRTRH